MNIVKTLDDLTKDEGIPLIIATSVERYVISPISFWCDIYAPPDQEDLLDPYVQRLFEVGHDHQSDVINESYTGAVQKIFHDKEEGLRLTLELLASGERFIKNMPLMCLPIGLQGRPDLLVRTDGIQSQLGPFGYCVVEIKSARNIWPAHILQGAVYNRLVGEAQGYEPTEFYMINRDAEIQTVRMADVDADLDAVLSAMRDVMNGKPVEPCYGAGEWPWESYVNNLAIGANDVSLIPAIGPAKRQTFIGAELRTVDAVAAANEQTLTKLQGVGAATARKFVTSAKAIQQHRPVKRENGVQIPHAETEVFFDLEGTDPMIGVDGLGVVNYLIGALVRSPVQAASFVPFFASSLEEEKQNLRDFFEWGASLGDAKFYHWHHYERTHLHKMADHYGLTPAEITPVMSRLVDLHPITTKSFAFPTYHEGLKDIAKYLGFTWRQDDVTALISVVLYFKYLDSDGTDEETRQKILDYNEDDCRATMHVYDWLLSQQEQNLKS